MEEKWRKFYEAGVAYYLDYPKLTLPQILSNNANQYSEHTSMVYSGKQWTYRELETMVNQMANLLIALGIATGDRVGIQLPNSPQFIIAYYGILTAGAVAVPINPQFCGDDLTLIINDSGMKACITSVEISALYKNFINKNLKVIVTDIKTPFGPDQNYSVSDDHLQLEQLLFTQSEQKPGSKINCNSIATLQYTGGTTGRSKGAVLTHYNLVANARQFRELFTNVYKDGEGRFICVIPLFHIYGLTTSMNGAVYSGSAMLLLPKFDLNDLMQLVDHYKANLFMGVPAMYGAMTMRDTGNYDLRSIKACVSGSAPLPLAIQEKFQEITGGRLVEGYGLSEASPVVAVNPIYGLSKNGSIGIPVPDTQVKIVDPQTGREITEPDLVGELVVKGPQVMQGYWNRPDETAMVLKDGWLHTGDLVKRDEDGYLYIADRLKDMIIMGGEKIYPREIEDLLYSHPAIREAAVIGVPHPLRGEVPEAYVALKAGAASSEKELRQFCAKHLAKFKVPNKINIVAELPRSSVGKVLRRLLRENVQ